MQRPHMLGVAHGHVWRCVRVRVYACHIQHAAIQVAPAHLADSGVILLSSHTTKVARIRP